MKNKVNEYKNRRYKRLLSRLDADDTEGRWITTENNHKIHLNAEGTPDKGNPHVIEKMTSGGGEDSGGKNPHERVKNNPNFVGENELKKIANKNVRYHLGSGETWADVDTVRVVSDPDKDGMADVEFEYHTNVRIPLGRDPETGVEQYEYDREYGTKTEKMKVLNAPEKSTSKAGEMNKKLNNDIEEKGKYKILGSLRDYVSDMDVGSTVEVKNYKTGKMMKFQKLNNNNTMSAFKDLNGNNAMASPEHVFSWMKDSLIYGDYTPKFE